MVVFPYVYRASQVVRSAAKGDRAVANQNLIPLFGPLQMIYFWFKNRKRARMLSSWASAEGAPVLEGWQELQPALQSRWRRGRLEAGQALVASRRRLQSVDRDVEIGSVPAVLVESTAGDWQSDRNICWGDYKGYTVVVWDTVYYNLNSDQGVDWDEEIHLHHGALRPDHASDPHHAQLPREASFGVRHRGRRWIRPLHGEVRARQLQQGLRVKARDERWAFAIIDQAMMGGCSRKKHTLELASGGITVSTWFTLDQVGVEEQLDFIVGFLDRFPRT